MNEDTTAHQDLWHDLLFGQRSLLLALAANLKRDFGLTIAQFEALLTLREAPGGVLGSTELGRSLLYGSGSTSHLLARLEELGHVGRSVHPDDGRVIEVRLTVAGRVLIDGARAAHRHALEAHFAPLIEPGELETLLRFARRLAAAQGVASRSPGALERQSPDR